MGYLPLGNAIKQVIKYRDRLVLVHGKGAFTLIHAFADQQGLDGINLSLELADHLSSIGRRSDRAKILPDLFSKLVSESNKNLLLLTRPEILFDPVLSIDPVRLFLNNAKNTTLVVQWPGKVTATSLSYATPGHSEYRSWRLSELGETILINTDEDH